MIQYVIRIVIFVGFVCMAKMVSLFVVPLVTLNLLSVDIVMNSNVGCTK